MLYSVRDTQTMRRNTERITQFIKHRYLFKNNNNALLCVYMYLKCFWNKIFFNIIVCSFFLSEYGQSRRRLSQYFDYLIIVWLLHNLYSEIYLMATLFPHPRLFSLPVSLCVCNTGFVIASSPQSESHTSQTTSLKISSWHTLSSSYIIPYKLFLI